MIWYAFIFWNVILQACLVCYKKSRVGNFIVISHQLLPHIFCRTLCTCRLPDSSFCFPSWRWSDILKTGFNQSFHFKFKIDSFINARKLKLPRVTCRLSWAERTLALLLFNKHVLLRQISDLGGFSNPEWNWPFTILQPLYSKCLWAIVHISFSLI